MGGSEDEIGPLRVMRSPTLTVVDECFTPAELRFMAKHPEYPVAWVRPFFAEIARQCAALGRKNPLAS